MPKSPRKSARRLAAEGLSRPAGRTPPPRRAKGLLSTDNGLSTGNALPLEVARQAQREMDRLRRLLQGRRRRPRCASTFNWLWSLPWDVTSSGGRQPEPGRRGSQSGASGLPKAKERILEYLAVRQLKPDLRVPRCAWSARPEPESHRSGRLWHEHSSGPSRASASRGRPTSRTWWASRETFPGDSLGRSCARCGTREPAIPC